MSSRLTGATDLSGKVVVVSATGTRVGAAIARGLATAGAHVVLGDRTTPDTELPPEVMVKELDGADPQSWAELARSIGSRHVDGYVHCGRFDHHAGIDTVSLEAWNGAISSNITAAVLGLQALVPMMRSGSSTVFVGSSTAYTGYPSAADTTTAWALRGMTHAADLELADLGIRVNALHCGFFAEDLAEAPIGFEEIARAATTRGRLIEHEDVTAFTAFLLSDASDYMTSGDIRLDGGATAHAGSRMARAGMAH